MNFYRIDTVKDKILVSDESAGDWGAASPYALVSSVLTDAGSGRLRLTSDSSVGAVSFTFDDSGLVTDDVTIEASYGLSVTGGLAEGVSISLNLLGLPASGSVQDTDYTVKTDSFGKHQKIRPSDMILSALISVGVLDDITISSTAPLGLGRGALWLDTSQQPAAVKINKGGWVAANRREVFGARSTASVAPPEDPAPGDVWFSQTDDKTYTRVYDGLSYVWVQTGG